MLSDKSLHSLQESATPSWKEIISVHIPVPFTFNPYPANVENMVSS